MFRSRVMMWVVWAVASLFYAYQYILRVMPNVMLQEIMQRFHIDAATFGQLSGVYYIGYSLAHIPLGLLLDRYGPKKVMSLSVILTGVGLLPLVTTYYWVYPMIGRFLIGCGSSAAVLGLFSIIRIAFPENRFARMLSLSVMLGLFGAVYGGGPLYYLVSKIGYSTIVYAIILLSLVLAVLIYCVVPSTHHRSGNNPVWSDIRTVLGHKKIVWLCVCAGLMVGPLEGFADVWGSAFLNIVRGIESTVAASLPSLMFLGMCFGAPILSLIAEKMNNYLLTILGAGAIMTVGFVLLFTYPLTATALSIDFILIGICCSYQILAIYQASTYSPPERAGLTTAVANMIIMIFGYGFHSAIGFLVSAFAGSPPAVGLIYGVSVIPIALFIGFVGTLVLLLKSTKKSRS